MMNRVILISSCLLICSGLFCTPLLSVVESEREIDNFVNSLDFETDDNVSVNDRAFGWWWPEFPGRFEPFFDLSYDVNEALTEDMRDMNGVAVADFNNDGLLDIAVSWKETAVNSDYWGYISLFIHQGDNQGYDRVDVFELQCVWTSIQDLDAADYDGDGDIDLLFTYSEHVITGGGLPLKINGMGVILFNDGDLTFTRSRQVFWHGPGDPDNIKKNRINPQVASADFNDDGSIDFAVGDNTGKVALYLNDGHGFFSCACTSSFGNYRGYSWGIAAADFDNDELVDFVVTQYPSATDGYIYLKHNDGSDTCFNHSSYRKIAMVPDYDNLSFFTTISPLAYGCLDPIDYDNNGRMDLVFGGIGYILMYMQVEPGVFDMVTVCRFSAENVEGLGGFEFEPNYLELGGIDVADLDGDGWEDVVVGGSDLVIETLYGTHTFVDIVQPDAARLIRDDEILMWFLPSYVCLKRGISIVFGDVTVVANELTSLSKVEFYLGNKLMFTDDKSPFEWDWTRFSFGRHTVKAVAYDLEGNSAGYDTAYVWKFL